MTVTTAIVAATPITIPSAASALRILWAMMPSRPRRRQSLMRGRPGGSMLLRVEPSIAHANAPAAAPRDLFVVGDHHDGHAVAVQSLEDVHDLARGVLVEIAGGLVGQ